MPISPLRIIPVVSVVMAITLTASANTMSWVNVPIPAGTVVNNPNSEPAGLTTLDGYQSWDLTLDTTSDWTGAQLLIELTDGFIFQEGEGFGANGVTVVQPDPAGFGPLPSSEFDTYVFDSHGFGGLGVAPGCDPGDGPNPSCYIADLSTFSIIWNSRGADTADTGIFSIARITLSPDAQGTWSVAFTVAGEAGIIESSGGVINGALVPEPGSLGLMVLGVLGLLKRQYIHGTGGHE